MGKVIRTIKNKMTLCLFFVVSFIFALPSILYLCKHKTIIEFDFDWTYFYQLAQGNRLLNALALLLLFSVLFALYFCVIKKRRQLLPTPQKMFACIVSISLLFLIVIPYAGKDIYSYIANGWSAAHYGENPYYISAGQIEEKSGIQDEMFRKMADVWRYEKLTYGPLWALMSTLFSWLSFGNVFCAVIIYKLANFVVHILNCVLIYKLTRKDLPVLLYGLNPLVLFEALSNVHNDIYMVFFVLLAIFLVVRKKNISLSMISIAFATAIKYVPILILPFILLYYVRKKSIKDRVKICVYCGIEYILIMGLLYSLYFRDWNVFFGLFLQQKKYNSSLLYLIYQWTGRNDSVIGILKNALLGAFAISYAYVVIKLLISEKMTLYQNLEKYNKMLFIFTFVLITNFNSWYMLWFFASFMIGKGRHVKNTIYLSYGAEFANIISFVLFLKIPYLVSMMGIMLMLNFIEVGKRKMRLLKKGENG